MGTGSGVSKDVKLYRFWKEVVLGGLMTHFLAFDLAPLLHSASSTAAFLEDSASDF